MNTNSPERSSFSRALLSVSGVVSLPQGKHHRTVEEASALRYDLSVLAMEKLKGTKAIIVCSREVSRDMWLKLLVSVGIHAVAVSTLQEVGKAVAELSQFASPPLTAATRTIQTSPSANSPAFSGPHMKPLELVAAQSDGSSPRSLLPLKPSRAPMLLPSSSDGSNSRSRREIDLVLVDFVDASQYHEDVALLKQLFVSPSLYPPAQLCLAMIPMQILTPSKNMSRVVAEPKVPTVASVQQSKSNVATHGAAPAPSQLSASVQTNAVSSISQPTTADSSSSIELGSLPEMTRFCSDRAHPSMFLELHKPLRHAYLLQLIAAQFTSRGSDGEDVFPSHIEALEGAMADSASLYASSSPLQRLPTVSSAPVVGDQHDPNTTVAPPKHNLDRGVVSTPKFNAAFAAPRPSKAAASGIPSAIHSTSSSGHRAVVPLLATRMPLRILCVDDNSTNLKMLGMGQLENWM